MKRSVIFHSRGACPSFGGFTATLHSAALPQSFICGVAAPFIRRSALPFIRRTAALFIAAALAIWTVSANAETVQIATAADWANFATRVNSGETWLNAALAADVALGPTAPRVGTDDRNFVGDFNGGGHTLSVSWNFTGTQYAAPFAFVRAAKIHDLHVTGSIVSDDKFAAGLVGCVKAENGTFIERCRVSVAITLMISGEAACGGFIGNMTDSGSCRATIRDCLFDGSLIGQSANGCGGFVGWKPHASYLYLYSCLFAPKAITVSEGGSYSATFSRSSSSSFKIDSGSTAYYYLLQYGLAQGTDASSMSAENLAASLGSAWTVSGGKVCLALFPNPHEATESGFTYQGVLRDAQGFRLAQKEHTVEFRLYEGASGGEALWGRSYPVLLDTNGLFNVALSDAAGSAIDDGTPTNGLAKALATHVGTPLYLGLTVAGSGAEISPRQKLLAVPVATMALDAAAASGDLAVAGKAGSSTAKIAGAATAGTLAATLDGSAGGNLAVGGVISGLGVFPVGAIVLWHNSVSSIPDGWKLCDGQNGTPNLRDLFVVGAGDEYSVGARGGEKTHTLTVDQMPSHTHGMTMWGGDIADDWKQQNNLYLTWRKYNYDNSREFNSTGGNQPHENRPPYYALCYIIRVR